MARKIRTIDAGVREVISVLEETNGGTGQSTFTTGDVLYSDGADSLTKLPIGTEGYILSSSGGVPQWTAAGDIFSSIIDIIRLGRLDALTPGVTRYLLPNFAEATNDDFIGYLVDGYGTLSELRVQMNVAPGLGEDVLFTVVVNGVDTLLEAAVIDSGTEDYNTANISVNPGDRVSLKAVSSAGSIAADIQASITYIKRTDIVYEDTIDIITIGKIGIVTPNVTRYLLPNFAESTTEAFTAYLITEDGYLDDLRVYADTAPGGAETVVITIRVEGVDTALIATLTGADQEASNLVNSESVLAGDRITIKSVSSVGSAAANLYIICRVSK